MEGSALDPFLECYGGVAQGESGVYVVAGRDLQKFWNGFFAFGSAHYVAEHECSESNGVSDEGGVVEGECGVCFWEGHAALRVGNEDAGGAVEDRVLSFAK